MKNLVPIFILFSTLMNAQQSFPTYSDLWNEVSKLEADNLPKSANEKVEKIYLLAKKDQNSPQLIKALLFQSKFAMILEEDEQLNIIHRFEKEISESDFPTKNILESILANLYWQYFQQNRWQFYNRTETAEKVDATDFRTWDLMTLFKEVEIHFDASLQNAEKLQNTDLKLFEELLITESESKIYRPSLYDFLAHQALDFYKTDEKYLTKPAYKFELDNLDYLSEAKKFVGVTIETKDTLSLPFKALQIFKQLTAFHLQDEKPDALIVLDIERLNFVRQYASFKDKDEVLLQTLIASKNEYLQNESGTLYDAEIAQMYYNQGLGYNAKNNPEPQWQLKKALEICSDANRRFPESLGAKKCNVIRDQILQPNIQLTAEEYIPVQKASRVLISAKNIDELHFKILKINTKQLEELNQIYNDSTRLQKLKTLPLVKSWSQKLTMLGDFQTHSQESMIPALEQGLYVVMASPEANFDKKYTFSVIQATDFALVEWNNYNEQRMQIVNRTNGSPVAGASVHIKTSKDNHYDKAFDKTFTTDADGFIYLPKKVYYYNLTATVTKGDKSGIFGSFYINQSYSRQEKVTAYHQVFLFTDRSIYRPGQKVFFKAIVIERTPVGKLTTSQVLPDTEVEAVLKDVNWQEIGKLTLKTNEFGSVAGEFTLPENGLTGEFHLEIKNSDNNINGSTYFSVEEYKRPKFETEFKPLSGVFKVNDTVKVIGTATAFAGNNISDAKVVYRVVRKVQYPHWWYWRMPYFTSEPQEITHGETVTNESGEYEIAFTAIPDKSVDEKGLPIFQYEITADVTDINGETHTATTTVNVGYHTMTAQINTSTSWNTTDEEQKISIITQNLNGEKVSAKGSLKIYKLKAPTQVKRPSPWEAPDFQTWTETEFNKLFPHDFYGETFDNNNRETGKMVYTATFENTDTDTELVLNKEFKDWEAGSYQIVLETQDKFGFQITEKTNFELVNPNAKKVADEQLLTIFTDKTGYTPGEKIKLKIGSASPDATVIVLIEKDKKIAKTYSVVLHDEIKTLEIPVEESDLGGFSIAYQLVNFNYFQSGNVPVYVFLKQPELTIETKTFRDKMQPGSEQTWSFTIKGFQKDQKTAELLASMYDASLDQFKAHQWQVPYTPLYNYYWNTLNASAGNSFRNAYFHQYNFYELISSYQDLTFDQLNWFGFSFGGYGRVLLRGMASRVEYKSNKNMPVSDKVEAIAFDEATPAAEMKEEVEGIIPAPPALPEPVKTDFSDVKIRTNFNETAFFYPQLTTDSEGNVSFTFTSPEALTRWKLQLLGHTKNMQTAYQSATSVTQKELMLMPNAPRFLREGDQLIFSTKISNLSENSLNGVVLLELTDAVTGKNIDLKLTNLQPQQTFNIDSKGNTSVSWTLQIPLDVQAVQYKIAAKAGDFSDGEQNVLPVLSNRMLVTETLPMWINSHETKTFTLDKLKNNTSTTLQNHKLTLEVTSNPVWYAIQALPYLMEYPYECSEQTFSRYYANALATKIVNDNPKIKDLFDQWENSDALLSNLEKNEELKSLLISETPWLRDAQSESEQKKRIALLFDLKKMTKELEKTAQKLYDMQLQNGGFPWFKGSRYPDRYITQHIAEGFGHLEKLGVFPLKNKSMLSFDEDSKTHNMLTKAIGFLDDKIIEDYNELEKQAKIIREKAKNKKEGEKLAKEYMEANHLGAMQLHYLYTRTFYKDIAVNDHLQKVMDYYTKQAYQYWKDYGLYQKGLIALVANRNENQVLTQGIVKSLDENSVTNPELGMYWKENKASWYWYQAPIETQALMIETFAEVKPVQKQLDNLKVWLLKNKQTNRWETTKSTTEAIYALLACGTDWTQTDDLVEVTVGNEKITPNTTEAGTGYFKTSWNAQDIKPEQAVVTLVKKDEGIAWGGLYWQYFENLDKITFAETPLKISKKLFLKQNTDTGEKLFEIKDSTPIKLGDLIRVRIELKVDREMEFIHMKDMRASGFEPLNVLSGYHYQDGLGYYESTKDAATNFFFDHLNKGVYVFEYDLRANNAGDFSNGITTIQCMYAPEFSSHSEGVRIKISQ